MPVRILDLLSHVVSKHSQRCKLGNAGEHVPSRMDTELGVPRGEPATNAGENRHWQEGPKLESFKKFPRKS